jgi:hypothetical protein
MEYRSKGFQKSNTPALHYSITPVFLHAEVKNEAQH